MIFLNSCVEGQIDHRKLEESLGDYTRAVKIRRQFIQNQRSTVSKEPNFMDSVPFQNLDYSSIFHRCCENVIGYVPIPVGIAGPLVIDGEPLYVPIATTEGALTASISRGAKAISMGGGATAFLNANSITRAPCLKFLSLSRARQAKEWLESGDAEEIIKSAFSGTSGHITFEGLTTFMVGELLYVRFKAFTGDAMGMNMVSIAADNALACMKRSGFEDMEVISLSGNVCSDKKSAAINWLEGRGKSVSAQARIPAKVVESVLKTTPSALVELNTAKNLIGSAISCSLGGFNAHASNTVSAIFLATGQDVAQNVESSNCITTMSLVADDLLISVTMPSIEVGTVGGGTILPAQASLLDLLGVRGSSPHGPGVNSAKLAKIIASTVLAGELSVCAALASNDLVRSHQKLNRKR
ncbi:HMG-CoA reductase [Aspergillus alliaceus]|uniref:HMG-CoA reductase n=1 Tax=Petromyces alliaceus TaxID=209559 RepID=UPI0012A49F22|nr:hydroxymethylglutaryl-CoA reductase [Aspergillus alliaceus]KAB8226872.1 hydroxymethylglutaryl-CoA reductase [Aspergillus alliaceus]